MGKYSRHIEAYTFLAEWENIMSNTTTLNKQGHVMDMTRGNPYKLILTFTFPIFLSQLFQQLYNTADAFIVGRFLGSDAFAAVSSSGTLIFLLISFFSGLAMGAGVVISRYFGAKDEEKLKSAVHTSLALGIACSVILTLVGVFLTPTLLSLMKTDPDIMPEAVEYFRYYFLGSFPMVMYNICKGIMNAVGDSRRPLYYLIFSSVVNIVLDLIFIGIFGWGVWSAAVATVISQLASFVLCMIHLMRPGEVFSVKLRRIRFEGASLCEIIRYGLPSGVQNSVIALANVIVQTNINDFGKMATSAYGAHSKIEGFAFLPITSFNMATTTFVSQNLGAREHKRAQAGARFGIIAAVILAEIVGIVYYIFAPALIGAFDSTAKVVLLGTKQARTVGLFYFLLAFSHSVASVCRGAGKAFVPMFVMLSVWCVFRIAYITVIMHFFDKIGYIYWAYPLTWAISSVIYLVYYLCSDWVHGFDNEKKVI